MSPEMSLCCYSSLLLSVGGEIIMPAKPPVFSFFANGVKIHLLRAHVHGDSLTRFSYFYSEMYVCMKKLDWYAIIYHISRLRLVILTHVWTSQWTDDERNLQEFTVWSIRNNIAVGPAQIIVWVNMKRAGIVCSVSVDSLKVYEDVAGCTEVLLVSPGRFEGIRFIDTDTTLIILYTLRISLST